MNDSILTKRFQRQTIAQTNHITWPLQYSKCTLWFIRFNVSKPRFWLRSSDLNSTHTLQQKLENIEKICFELALQIKETLHIPIAQLECKQGNKMR